MLDKATNQIIDNIVACRKNAGMSQADVTIKLQQLGFNYGHGRLSMIETKRRPPSAALILALKLIFKCEYADFYKGVETDFSKLLK